MFDVYNLSTLGKVCTGLGSAATNVHRDIYKAAKTSLSGDRAVTVRSAAASCILAMAPYASFLYEAPNGELKFSFVSRGQKKHCICPGSIKTFV